MCKTFGGGGGGGVWPTHKTHRNNTYFGVPLLGDLKYKKMCIYILFLSRDNNFVICAFMGVLHYLPFQIVYDIIVTLLQELKKLYLYAVNNI